MITGYEDILRAIEQETGFKPDRPIPEMDGWHYGERIRALEDDDNEMYSSDETGYLIIEEVGSARHDNVRQVFAFLPDGSDCPEQINIGNFEIEQ